MESTLQNQIAFFLTGRRDQTLQAIDDKYRPALFARYADLTSLRYDLPLVLNRDAAPSWAVLSLSHLVDHAIEGIASASESLRVARHGHRLEREVRRQLEVCGRIDLADAWTTVTEKLSSEGVEGIKASADVLWNSFQANGDLAECGLEFPGLVIRHAWASVQADKARAFRRKAERLHHVLGGILAAEVVGSAVGRAPERLRAGVGASFAETFDFNAMSNILAASRPEVRLSDERRQRVEHLLEVLQRQRFYPLDDDGPEPYPFAFDSCAEALSAYNERYPAAVELCKTLAIAELEAAGEYRESIHDVLFDSFGANGLDPAELGQLPDYLICTDGVSADPAEPDRLIQLLTAGVPFKILLQTDDVFEPSGVAKGNVTFASRARSICSAALGMTDVFVLQASASQLFGEIGSLLSGLTYDGPALFSVFSGANTYNGDVPAYLVAAAATEARVFPTVIFDPSKSEDGRARIDVSPNPQPDNDWPIHRLEYESANIEAVAEESAFTAADFMAMDRRLASHFALVPADADPTDLITVTEALNIDMKGLPDKVPFVPLVDANGFLRRAVIDDRTLQDASRCLALWRGLKASRATESDAAAAPVVEPVIIEVPASSAEIKASETAAETDNAPAVDHGDDPYIETERCTTCNECTLLNNRMFAYNENKQAYVADPDAGTFRQLVEAAEGCQVSIIHPGKPRNPKEPGLEDLIVRAAEFN